jgi:SNF2 family DNA or RNA helicase/Holliday junction resolvase
VLSVGISDLIKSFIKGDGETEKEFISDFSSDEFVKIYLEEEDKKIKIEEENEDIFTLVSLTNLELADDNSHLKIKYEQLYELYYSEGELIYEYQSLGLPDLYNGFIHIENLGNFIQDEEVKYSFAFKGLNDNYDISLYKKNILNVGQEYKVLPLDMYQLIIKLNEYNDDETTYQKVMNQFELFGNIKEYADQSNILLNTRLSNEERPIIVDEITIDFDKKDKGLEIYPQVTEKDESFNQNLVKKFDQSDKVRNFYNVNDKGQKRKVIFKNKESAEKVKRNRFLSGEDELKFYRGENELWDDEKLDLSNFGPRVRGFGYLNYRANAISSDEERDNSWFDLGKVKEPPKIYTQSGKSIEINHKDKDRLKKKLRDMKKESKEVIEVGFTDNKGTYKMPLTEEQIVNEIKKINNATFLIDEVQSIKIVEKIKEKLQKQEDEEYVEFNGMFVRTYNLQYLEQHLADLRQKKKEKENNQQEDKVEDNDESTIIADNLEEEEYVVDAINSANEEDLMELEIPKALDANLYPHQELGVKRLQYLYRNNKVSGLLLADDMGLGKTLQLLTFLAWLKENQQLNTALIVAPTTLINNWDNRSDSNPGEIQKFFPDDLFKTYKLRGRIKAEKELDKIRSADIVFTSYTSLRMNSSKLKHSELLKVHWDVMICDEAQKVKNATTQVSVAVKAQNADFKIACSATPIENNLLDLWNIMDYAIPGILNSKKSFRKEYVNQLAKFPRDELEKRKELNQELTDKIEQNFLRRNKKDELDDLPKKKIKVYGVPANQHEIDRIKELNRLRMQGKNHLPLIQKLVALCSHIQLIDSEFDDCSIKEKIELSSKLKKVKEIFDDIKAKDEKVLIFTIFRKMQKILIKAINYWYGFRPSVLNGTIAQNKRQKIIDEFRHSEGFNIIVLSPEVAGVGIDLVEANHVIHYTRLWNPAKEDQATDRVYRIGQKKDVYVYYLILTLDDSYLYNFNSETEYVNNYLTKDVQGKSPEEKLNKLLVKKKNLLLNFFFAAGDSNIDWNSITEDEEMNQADHITINNIYQSINPSEFEILISKLYERQGYEVYPTVQSGDNGVDVVAIKDNKLTLIQCKQLKKEKLPRKAINEVFGGKNIYANKLGKKVKELIVVTTAKRITNQTQELAKQNKVKVILKDKLSKMLEKHQVYYSEIDIENEERYSLERLKRLI